jgi:hypothetical protein
LTHANLSHFARNPAAFDVLLPHVNAITIIASGFCYTPNTPLVEFHDLWRVAGAHQPIEGLLEQPNSNSVWDQRLRARAKFNSFLDKVSAKLHQCPRLNSVTFKGPIRYGSRPMYTGSLDSLRREDPQIRSGVLLCSIAQREADHLSAMRRTPDHVTANL